MNHEANPAVVPETIGTETDPVLVSRAWPTSRVDADGRVALLAEGPDATGRLRAARVWLRRSAAGSWVADETSLTRYGQDRKLPELERATRRGQLVVHRFGKRAVVATSDSYLKVVRTGGGARIAEQAEQGRRVAESADFDAPQVLAQTDAGAEFSIIPGVSLHDAGRTVDLNLWERAWAAWARRWPSLVTSGEQGLPEHTAADEQRTLKRWSSAVTELGLLPTHVSEQFSARVARASEALGEGSGRGLVVSHRDLHDKQILLNPETGRLGLLDFDIAALAEPELDLANLAVHIVLRRDQGWWSREHAAVATTYVREVVAEVEADPERMAVYAEATRCRLASLYLFRPRYRALALQWAAAG